MNPSKLKIELVKKGMNNRDLAKITGYSEKQISLIVNGKSPISKSFALLLVNLFPNTTIEGWISENEKPNDDELCLWEREISLSKILKNSELLPEQEITLAKAALNIVTPVDYLPSSSANLAYFEKENRKNCVDDKSLLAWIDICLFCYKKTHQVRTNYSEALLEKYLPLIKVFSASDEPSLTSNYMSMFCKTVGINAIFVPSFPTSFVRGLVTKKDDAYFLFVTSRYETNPFLWFTFLHELFHLKNGDLNNDGISLTQAEDNASKAAKEFFVGTEFQKFEDEFKKNPSESSILSFSEKRGISPGMTVTFLWHDDAASYKKFHYLVSKTDAFTRENIFKACYEKISSVPQ